MNLTLLNIYFRQFGDGVSITYRQMDFIFAIGEMRRHMFSPAIYS